MKLTIDFETRSACDLKKHGAWVYSEDPTTEVLCMAFKWEGAPAMCLRDVWREESPEGARAVVETLLRSADVIEAHNASFEYAIWTNVCAKRYGWPPLPAEKLRCSASKAAMHSLPRHLEGACQALGLPVQKDMEGYRLMLKMCKPRRPRKDEPERNPEDPRGYYWHEDPSDLERLYQYCIRDVESEECLSAALRDLPDSELKIWQLDQIINARGIQADINSCHNMIAFVGQHEARLLKRLRELTNGAVKTAKQVEQLKEYLRGLGVDLLDLAAATVKEALKGDVAGPAREILEIRRSLGRSSASKYQAIIDRASSDGRVRGSLLYHGAGTGRWSGAGIQPQNFPSRIEVSDEPETMLRAINAGGYELFQALYDDDPMSAAGAATRSALCAAPGCDLVVADLSAIEGRTLAWLAGEEVELDVYRHGKDPYIASASMILHKPYGEITKKERQSPGKISVLACIAEGSLVLTDHGLVPIEEVDTCMRVWDGVEWVTHCGTIFRGVKEVIGYDGLQATPDHVVFTEEGREVRLREASRSKQRLAQTGFGGTPIRLGEDYQPRYADEGGVPAAISAVPRMRGGEVDRHGELAFGQTERPVWDILNCGPRNRFTVSGKLVHNCGYQGGAGAVRKFGGEGMTDDEIKEQIVNPWRDAHPMTVNFWHVLEDACMDAVATPGKITRVRAIAFKVKDKFLGCRLPSGRMLYYYDPLICPCLTSWGDTKDCVTYMTVDGLTKKWVRTNTYGGKIAENVTQAVARDIMAAGMLNAEAAGYKIVASVHDELLAEVPEGFGSVEEFEGLMCKAPAWAAGLPLKAAGFRSKRYKK